MKQAGSQVSEFLGELTRRLAQDKNWSQTAREMSAAASVLPALAQRRLVLRLLNRLQGGRDGAMSRIEKEVLSTLYHDLVAGVYFDEIDLLSVLFMATDRAHPDWFLLKPALQKFTAHLERGGISAPLADAYRRFIQVHGASIPREATELLRDMLTFCKVVDPATLPSWMERIEAYAGDRAARLKNTDLAHTEACLRDELADEVRKLLSRAGASRDERPRLTKFLDRLAVDSKTHSPVDLASEAQAPPGARSVSVAVVNYFTGKRIPSSGPEMAAYLEKMLSLDNWDGHNLLQHCDPDWVQRCFIKAEELEWPSAYVQIIEMYRACNRDPNLTLSLLLHLAGATGTVPSPNWLVNWTMLSLSLDPTTGLAACERLAELPGSSPDLVFDDLSVCVARGAMWGMTRWRHERTPGFLWVLARTRLRQGENPMLTTASAIKALELMGTPEALNELMQLRGHADLAYVRRLVDAALNRIATARGVDSDTLQDMAVNRCGMGSGPVRVWQVPEAQVTLRIDPRGKIEKGLYDPESGRALEDVPPGPSAAFRQASEERNQVAASLMLVYDTQKRRLEGALSAGRSWSYSAWSEIFVRHPILAHLACRLVWRVELVGPARYLIPDVSGEWSDSTGRHVRLHPDASLSLAHPASISQEALLHWQERIVEQQIVQPFKQLFRETYLLMGVDEGKAGSCTRYSRRDTALARLLHATDQRGWAAGSTSAMQQMLELQKDYSSHGIRASLTIRRGKTEREDGTLQEITFRHLRGRSDGSTSTGAIKTGDLIVLKDVPSLVFSETVRDVELSLAESEGDDVAPQADDWNQQVRANPRLWPQMRQEYSRGSRAPGRARGNLLQQVVAAMGLSGRVSLQGSLAIVRGGNTTFALHLGTGHIYRDQTGEEVAVMVPQHMVSNLYMPFEDEDLLTRDMVSKVILLANDELAGQVVPADRS